MNRFKIISIKLCIMTVLYIINLMINNNDRIINSEYVEHCSVDEGAPVLF